jgi:hypothetical protein
MDGTESELGPDWIQTKLVFLSSSSLFPHLTALGILPFPWFCFYFCLDQYDSYHPTSLTLFHAWDTNLCHSDLSHLSCLRHLFDCGIGIREIWCLC